MQQSPAAAVDALATGPLYSIAVPQLVVDVELDVVEASHRMLDDGRHTDRVILVVAWQMAPAAPALGTRTQGRDGRERREEAEGAVGVVRYCSSLCVAGKMKS